MGTRLVAAGLLAMSTALLGCAGATVPKDSDLSVPEGFTVIADDGGGCGDGDTYECGRVWLVVGPPDVSTEAVREALLGHLVSTKGWSERAEPLGPVWKIDLPGRGQERYGTLEPFGGTFDAEYFTRDQDDRALVESPLAAADLPSAEANGVVVGISYCCGDGLLG